MFLYPDADQDRSQNLMGCKFDQDPSSDFFGRFNQQHLHNPPYKQRDKWS